MNAGGQMIEKGRYEIENHIVKEWKSVTSV